VTYAKTFTPRCGSLKRFLLTCYQFSCAEIAIFISPTATFILLQVVVSTALRKYSLFNPYEEKVDNYRKLTGIYKKAKQFFKRMGKSFAGNRNHSSR